MPTSRKHEKSHENDRSSPVLSSKDKYDSNISVVTHLSEQDITTVSSEAGNLASSQEQASRARRGFNLLHDCFALRTQPIEKPTGSMGAQGGESPSKELSTMAESFNQTGILD